MKGNMNESSTGLQSNIAAVLAYLFGWISGIILLIIERNDNFVRFHAMQSVMFSAIIWIATAGLGILIRIFMFVPVVGSIMRVLIGLVEAVIFIASVIFWIILMVKAYHGEWYKIPVIGDAAEANVDRV
jgi:uncharacterized membrane protein